MTYARTTESNVLFYPESGNEIITYDSMQSALWCIRENSPVRKLRVKQLGPSYHLTKEVWGESLNNGICYFMGVLDASQA